MTRWVRSLVLASLAVLLLCGGLAFAQGGGPTSSLSGLVLDSSGAVLPGADVLIVHTATGTTYNAMTDGRGMFTVPAMGIGNYTITISLSGFKTAELKDVELNAGVPASVRATLELGELAETMTVQAASEIVQTQSSAVATTLNVNQIINLPLSSRNTLDFLSLMAGVDTARGDIRQGNVMGLPPAAVNITLDGLNIQDNINKSNEIFTRVSPRLDAVEEVTFSSAAQGAESGGQGAVQIRFVTRSGTNALRGSGYFYYQTDKLNTNTWFNKRDNLPTPELTLYQPGIRVGGPIVIPRLFDGHNKAFFFVNYEELRQPRTIKNDRTILSAAAASGTFLYNSATGVRSVNLLQLAAANGHIATFDPVNKALIDRILTSTNGTGTVTALSNPSLQRFTWQQDGENHNQYPTVRLDYNVTDRHRATWSMNAQKVLSDPDTTNTRQRRFPDFPIYGVQDSDRYTWQASVRSILGSSLVNEARYGRSGGATMFNPNWASSMFDDTNGYHINLNGTMALDNAGSIGTGSKQSREARMWVVEDALNWQKGSHSVAFGGSFTRINSWVERSTPAPTVNFGVVTGDPAQGMFATTNFPGASSTDLTNAQTLYNLLVGRISSITREARYDPETGTYVPMGTSFGEARLQNIGFYVQDSWRWRPDLTINAGLRYEIQTPFEALNSSYSIATVDDLWGVTGVSPDWVPGSLVSGLGYLFQPGVLKGTGPTYKEFTKGTKAYRTDRDNFGPSIGAAWTPTASSGFWQRFLGKQGDTVIRGGFTVAYQRNGISDFTTDTLDSNPGISVDVSRSQAIGNLGTLPVLFRNPENLYVPPFNENRVYPMPPPTVTGSVNLFDSNLQVPMARTWMIGYQRALTTTMAAEIRYVGTRNRDGWTDYNYNEYNIIENGFLQEFKLAQANLQANVAAGRGANFRYYGPGTGTSPLPIFLAYFNGVPSSQAGDASRYTSSDFASNTFLNPLALFNPNPFSAADNLDGSAARRANATTAGLPVNFLVVNPDMLGGANLTGNGGKLSYDGVQLELKRRVAGGLQFQANYAYGISYDSNRYSFRVPRLTTRQAFTADDDGGVTHAFKANWVYDLPFGNGRKWMTNANRFVETLLGGWAWYGTGRVQSGRLLDFGNVRLVGMTGTEFMKLFTTRIDNGQRVWMLPDDVIQNTVRAFNTSPTSPTGYGTLGPPEGRYLAPANSPTCLEAVDNEYGDCGIRTLVVTGPQVIRFDMSFAKRVPLGGPFSFEFRAEVFNVFNRVNFSPITGFTAPSGTTAVSLTGADAFEVTTAVDQARTAQLVFRLNW